MHIPREPKYEWGQRVVAGIDLFNDGSFPEREAQVLLVSKGTEGEVVRVGMHAETETPVYLVEFAGGYVVGCMEQEIELS